MVSERLKNWQVIGASDAAALAEAEKSYGFSWRNRGGVGAFMMLARKWDRIENQCKEENYNIFRVLEKQDTHPNGILDDIRDLRRYLTLVEEFVCYECAVGRHENMRVEFNRVDIIVADDMSKEERPTTSFAHNYDKEMSESLNNNNSKEDRCVSVEQRHMCEEFNNRHEEIKWLSSKITPGADESDLKFVYGRLHQLGQQVPLCYMPGTKQS